MNEPVFSRRVLLKMSGSVGAGWLGPRWAQVLRAAVHVHRAVTPGTTPRLEFFTAEQAAEVEAIAAQIIPSDETPGANEARVLYFIDRALVTFDREQQPAYREGLQDLLRRVQQLHPGKSFSGLPSDQQIELLKSMEETEFFGLVRTHTIMGFLANPEYGGNDNKVGWRLIGFKDDSVFTPPFGFYDREYNDAG